MKQHELYNLQRPSLTQELPNWTFFCLFIWFLGWYSLLGHWRKNH